MFDHYKMKMVLLCTKKKREEEKNVRNSPSKTNPSTIHLRQFELGESRGLEGGTSTHRELNAAPWKQK